MPKYYKFITYIARFCKLYRRADFSFKGIPSESSAYHLKDPSGGNFRHNKNSLNYPQGKTKIVINSYYTNRVNGIKLDYRI